MAEKPAQQPPVKQKKPKEKKKKLSKAERMALRAQQQQYTAPVISHPDDADFGDLILNQSQYRTNREWTAIKDLNKSYDGKEIWVRARVHTVRAQSKMAFLLLRRGFAKVQAGIFLSKDTSKAQLKYVSKLAPETIIDICGVVSVPKEAIKTATQQDCEIIIKRVYAVANVLEARLPFEIDDASRSELEYKENPKFVRVTQKTRLDNRWIDIRTTANHAIFRLQSGVGQYFREFLLKNDFIEIHSPKIIGAASEGGADVFKLGYFGNDAFLAQSPQLYKQMALCCDLKRVFEVGPVFRSEDSNTHRHLCEFTGLDLEMEFFEHYHEVVTMIGDMFIHIFKQLNTHFKREIDAVRAQYPFDDLLFQDKMLILTFKEAMDMLKEKYDQMVKEGKTEEVEALLVGDWDDFSTPMEKLLGRLVKDKFKTEFYAVDKYPLSARPFYTMLDPFDKSITNSYDFFIRGEEIMSGAQRIHDPKLLTERAAAHEIPVETLHSYIDSFKYGTSPHAGGGVGLERVAMLFLGLDNIRKASLFPRDPHRCDP